VVACGQPKGTSMRSGWKPPRRAGSAADPAGPVTQAGISEAAVRSQVALAFSALRAELAPLS
jgi:hypothetical protein